MIDSFRDRLLHDLTDLIPTGAQPPRSGATAEPSSTRRRGRLTVAVAATAAAAVGGALVVPMLGGSTGSTPAWAIERSQDGDVLITIHDFDDLARLQKDLRAAGVPAVVRAGSPTCGVWSVPSQPEEADVLRDDLTRENGDHFWRIDPRALKPNHVLAFLITHEPARKRGDFTVKTKSTHIIVAATDDPPCAPPPGIPAGPR